MKTKNLSTLAVVGFTIGFALLVPGCASSGYQKTAQTASTLEASANRIERAGLQLHQAVAALNDLITNPQPDLRPQFKKLSAAVSETTSLTNSIQEADANLQARGEVYFDNWDKELAAIQNGGIRARGQKRKQEVAGRYDNVRAACAKAQTQAEPLLSDLKDVHRFLNSDLTLGGLAAIKDATARVNQLSAPVQESVNKLVADMRALSTAMSPEVVTEK